MRTVESPRGGLTATWSGVASIVWMLLAMVGVAHAEPAFSVQDKLDGVPLGRHVEVLEDPSGALTLEDVQRPSFAMRFASPGVDAPSYGYTHSAYWLRLAVENEGERARPWLLELAYPHLDDVVLYTPDGQGGFTARETGDLRVFGSRDFAHRSFVFALDEPARSARTYLLRVKSTSSMNLSMAAWDTQSFLAFQPRDLGLLFLFYGVLVVMAVYNFCMWLFMRQPEQLQYVFFILSTGALQLTLSGHLFQFVLPDDPALAQHMIPITVACSLASACFLGNAYLAMTGMLEKLQRIIRVFGWTLLALGPASSVLPHERRLLLLIALFVALAVFACGPAMVLLKARAQRARLYAVAWGSVVTGFAITGLRVLGVLPSNLFTEWSSQLGSALQMVLLSSALADRINAMRRDVGALNGELSRKVELLERALQTAESATLRAEQATRVKDEFMATMSHELRTPLNAIINVPQGLLRDFPRTEAVSCASCNATFELEQGDKVTSATPCPDCGELALRPRQLVRYHGKPEATARYLHMIERSGRHLLQMVNGVLDFSKLEVGRMELVLESFELPDLVREVGDDMSLYAERMGVRLELDLPPSEELVADPVRVKQILINLLSNAVKFSDGATEVRVGLRSRPDAVELWVKDSGIGIAPEHFERVFGSFEQVHKGNTRKYGGTGLGLSISRSLARMHGGELWVESTLGQGSTFFLRIPRGLTGGRSRNASTKMSVSDQTVRRGEEMAS